MSKNVGTSVTDGLVAQGNNATHFDDYGQVGFRSVATLADRDAIVIEAGVLDADGISSGRRKAGMVVKVLEDNTIYSLEIPGFAALGKAAKLAALADNSRWVIAKFGSDVDKAYVNAADASLQSQINNLPPGVITAGTGTKSILGQGSGNVARGPYTVTVGGFQNQAQSDYNSVLGGYGNIAGGGTSITVVGGMGNQANGEFDTIVGGNSNYSIGSGNFIGGGQSNRHQYSSRSVIGGGNSNVINGGSNSAIVAGYNNTITGGSSFVGSGEFNSGNAGWGFIGGGTHNSTASNIAWASVVGGNYNQANGSYTFVSGGDNNIASGAYANILGGSRNTVNGANCHAYGCTNTTIGVNCVNVILINCHDFSVTTGTDVIYFNNQVYSVSDVTKAYVDAADALKAPKASPAFTGTPTAPTASAGSNNTQVATTAFVTDAVVSNKIQVLTSAGVTQTYQSYAAAENAAGIDDTIYLTGYYTNITIGKSVTIRGTATIKEMVIGYLTQQLEVKIYDVFLSGRVVTCIAASQGTHNIFFQSVKTAVNTYFEQYSLTSSGGVTNVTVKNVIVRNTAAFTANNFSNSGTGILRFQERPENGSGIWVFDNCLLESVYGSVITGYKNPSSRVELRGETRLVSGVGVRQQETYLLNTNTIYDDSLVLIDSRGIVAAIIKSPNGTRYRITVNDSGALSTVAV